MPPLPSTPSIRYPAKIVPILIAAAMTRTRAYGLSAAVANPGLRPTSPIDQSGSSRPLLAQLLEGLGALLQLGQPHTPEHARRLRELDVPVVDDLDEVAPRIAEVEALPGRNLHPGLFERRPDGRLIVDDEAEVAGPVGRPGVTLG